MLLVVIKTAESFLLIKKKIGLKKKTILMEQMLKSTSTVSGGNMYNKKTRHEKEGMDHALQRKNPIYLFSEKELLGLSPNFHIHVSMSDLYIPTFCLFSFCFPGLPILLQKNMWTDPGNI